MAAFQAPLSLRWAILYLNANEKLAKCDVLRRVEMRLMCEHDGGNMEMC